MTARKFSGSAGDATDSGSLACRRRSRNIALPRLVLVGQPFPEADHSRRDERGDRPDTGFQVGRVGCAGEGHERGLWEDRYGSEVLESCLW